MADPESRRPIASRGSRWATGMAAALAKTSITPNQISQASMVAAVLAALAFYFAGDAQGWSRIGLLIGAAVFCQLRLICNLLDGMVAVEASKGSSDGAFWNEFPDRISDIVIFVGVGYGVGEPTLGWAAAALAVLTAYTRELGRACGLDSDFGGPMAKPHRMALITVAAMLSVFEGLWDGAFDVLVIALWIIAIGAAVTTARRAWRMIAQMNA